MAGQHPSGGAERRFTTARGTKIRVHCDRQNDLAGLQAHGDGISISIDLPAWDLARLNDYVERVIKESAP